MGHKGGGRTGRMDRMMCSGSGSHTQMHVTVSMDSFCHKWRTLHVRMYSMSLVGTILSLISVL